MIAFDCQHCGKALILPNAKAGQPIACPACRQALVVPPPRKKSTAGRWFWLLPVGLGVVAGAVGLGIWMYQTAEPSRIRERFATRLSDFSPGWQGITWEKCDPHKGDYKLTVFQVRGGNTYTFAASRSTATDHTAVQVDPQPTEPKWLAYALFLRGELQTYDYTGKDGAEKEELEALSSELDAALRHAVP
jgi:hypothetical protein